jgi:glucose/arabinose dehydrogenase
LKGAFFMLGVALARHLITRRHGRQRAIAVAVAATCLLLGLAISSAHAAAQAVNWPLIRLELVAGGFANPVNLVDPNDGTDHLFVVERGGRIHIIENGQRLEDAFLDIESKMHTCPECGLLGLAFPPDFAESGYFFINYTIDANVIDPPPGDDDNNNDQKIGDTIIARLHVSDDPNVADVSSEEIVLAIHQPAGNHNGGHIFFGPDGYLYIGMGDGGGSGDEYNNAQDPQSLHGKILRIDVIDVSPTGTYTIPNDNPFFNNADYRPEIWATGVRNPWRFNFDRITGDLYVADVGQGALEEINYIPAAEIGNGGMNFGWPILEGNVCFPPSGAQACDRTDLVEPVVTYGHNPSDPDYGCSVTGGYVYHSTLPMQPPVYLYADFCVGTLSAMQREGDAWVTKLLRDLPFSITSFGEDHNGNLYLVSYEGDIYRFAELTNAQYIPSLVKEESGQNPE